MPVAPRRVMNAIRIERDVQRSAEEHARREPLVECCGMLAGRDGLITRAFPAVNAARNPATEYKIAPNELFQFTREIRAAGLQLLGIYHSHPNGKNEPSARDIEQAYYPDVAYFIISPVLEAEKPVRAFSICDGQVAELEIRVV
ncbi:MAG: M67 family metallopeptidase [Candidatus Acidiferrales bacterium]